MEQHDMKTAQEKQEPDTDLLAKLALHWFAHTILVAVASIFLLLLLGVGLALWLAAKSVAHHFGWL